MKVKSIMAGVAAALSLSAFADIERVGNIDWSYDTDDDVHACVYGDYKIAAIDAETSGDITIPSVLGGMPVTKVEEYAFYKCEKLRHVTIPSSVTAIGDEVQRLRSVGRHDSVEREEHRHQCVCRLILDRSDDSVERDHARRERVQRLFLPGKRDAARRPFEH